MSCVYKHTFPNGAIYIGKTDMEPEDRWLDGFGYRNSPMVFKAIVKYGWDNVQHDIIEDNLTHDEAIKLEQELIDEYARITDCIYNVQHIPAQLLAQETSHYIPPAQEIAQLTKENTPAQLLAQNKPKRRGITGEHYKDYVIPVVEKPPGVHKWPIDVYTADGKYITTYNDAKEAHEELGVNHGDIISCCKGVKANGKRRYQVKGYIFRYSDGKEKQ